MLDVADADLLFGATDAVIARRPGAALRRVRSWPSPGATSVQFMRDLKAHLRT